MKKIFTIISLSLLSCSVSLCFSSESRNRISIPAGFSAKAYGIHVFMHWHANPETELTGYEVWRSQDAGTNWEKAATLSRSDTNYTDIVKDLGLNLDLVYKMRAKDNNSQFSDYTDTVNVYTHELTDDELLDMVEEATFRYFWDFAHPGSGLARERNTSGDIVTSGGSGFGVMAILVGIERGYITREQGVQRMNKILDFLAIANRFHGAWPHWMNGYSGTVVPFSQQDDGGDLVETAYLVQGLLAARQYFNLSTPEEQAIVQKVTTLWEGVEWDWYRQNDSNALYWHWSPDYGWAMNMPIRGWNETMITYILAIASPTHGVPASLWESGWAGSSSYTNGNTFYGIPLELGPNFGGPLFFAHYSFLGFDPRNKKDQYANYFIQNLHHTQINRQYCIHNPKAFEGYSDSCWGLTASDDPTYGYLAHEPFTNDNGTITPSAALSSIVYTPEYSLKVLKHFYYDLGDKIWGNMGFYDAFNQKLNWYTNSYLAIDQGPIIDMIENYRTGLLWNLFMSNPEIQPALDSIGFVYDSTSFINENHQPSLTFNIYPNPARDFIMVSGNNNYDRLLVIDFQGKKILEQTNLMEGTKINIAALPKGIYLIRLFKNGVPGSRKFVKY